MTVNIVARLGLFVLVVSLIGWNQPSMGADPFIEKVDLFQAGEDGYQLYRIPGIVVTKRGTVLAYCEARKSARNDWGASDVIMRRSTDGGRRWLPPQLLVHLDGDRPTNSAASAQGLDRPGENTVNNPLAIAELNTSKVHVLYCVEYMNCFYMWSEDEGKTWTDPIDLTPTFDGFREIYDWKVIATGPGHGIQLSIGKHAGRIVVPVWLSLGTGGHAHHPSVTATIFSDDHGQTWQRGQIAINDSTDVINPNEATVVELSDGRVLLNARNESKSRRRVVTVSPDGATGWSLPEFDDALLEPVCMASLARLRAPTPGQPGVIGFVNPDNSQRRDRTHVTIKISMDDCKTWPVGRCLEEGVSAYSDLALASDGNILCFYERGEIDSEKRAKLRFLTVARFNEAWINAARSDGGLNTKP